MSVPPVDLDQLKDYDTPEIVAPAFRRFRWGLVATLLLVAAAAGFAGYSVDKTRTHDQRELLRRADSLHTQAPADDPLDLDVVLPYFALHNDLAAAAKVDSCSAFAIRMTQRFLPEGWHFNADDVAALQRGEDIPALRVEVGAEVPYRWQC